MSNAYHFVILTKPKKCANNKVFAQDLRNENDRQPIGICTQGSTIDGGTINDFRKCGVKQIILMRTHKIQLPFEVAPELIYEQKTFLIIDSQVTGINEIAFGDQVSIVFLQKVSTHPEIPTIETGDFMIVEVKYIEVINETMIVVSIKPKSYHANTFSVMY